MSRSLTYSELAKALEITPESANRLARRKHWPRVKGNDGRTRVAVPEDFCPLDSPPDSPGDGPDSPGDSPPVGDKPPDNPVHAQIARLEGELAGPREALAEARARVGAAEANAKAAEARADAEAAKTAQAIRAFESLAERFEAMAEAQKAKTLRRWWRRIVRRSFAGDELSAFASWRDRRGETGQPSGPTGGV